ncbi:MAG: glycosyltransferase family 2 protein [Bacteroidia bacterium]|nr:glycosyltransferase family 2 protein [Bacteroidia bacterium]
MSAEVTIIVPVYNIEHYLAETLDSILAQTYTNWVCLLVNDGSTDESQRVIDCYCSQDKRFKGFFKRNERSADLVRKYAIQYVETEWVMPIDGDDVIVPEYIERMVQRQIETGADLVMSRFVGCVNGINGVDYMTPDQFFDMSQVLEGRQVCIDNIGGWTSSLNGALYRKSLTEGVLFGPYMNSDEFSQRLIEYNANKVAFCDVRYLYRSNDGTSTKVSVRMFDRTLVDMQLEQFVCDYFPERDDKVKALAWQRLFNLIYLTADYKIHRNEFTSEEREKALMILRQSYFALNRRVIRTVAPVQTLMLTHSFLLFSLIATAYVRYKRSHGGKYFYR